MINSVQILQELDSFEWRHTHGVFHRRQDREVGCRWPNALDLGPSHPSYIPVRRLGIHGVSPETARDILARDVFSEWRAVVVAKGASDQVLVSAFRDMLAHAVTQACVPQSVTLKIYFETK